MSYRDELVTLGDVLDFLEWRRVNRGVQYFPVPTAPLESTRPSVRFYYHLGRTYTISNKGQMYRLKEPFERREASKVSCCSFGDNQSSWITPGLSDVRVQTKNLDKAIRLKEGVMSSLFENGYVAERYVQQSGNRLIGCRL